MIRACTPAANSRPATYAPESRVGPVRCQPPGVAVHPDELGTRPNKPERAVEIGRREHLRRVADDDGSRACIGARRLLVAEQPLALELGERVIRCENVQRRPRVTRAG